MNQVCSVCGGKLYGFKCVMCGVEQEAEDPSHLCGPERCEAKCVGCGKVEKECTCEPIKKDISQNV
jgi:hypothetical protein